MPVHVWRSHAGLQVGIFFLDVAAVGQQDSAQVACA